MEKLKYPIGQFEKPDNISLIDIKNWVDDIRTFPEKVRIEVDGLNEEKLAWIYRSEGWSIQQLIHHCADSHMNAFIRFKLALTENNPTIRPYLEDRWAKLPDTTQTPIILSLQLLEALHSRWTVLLENITPEELKRTFVHPEHGAQFTLEETIGSYAWHCNHHLEHIRQAKKYQGQF
ncbi:MAG: YfiT family bacillithiol transferase [Bacteroidota bacterium]